MNFRRWIYGLYMGQVLMNSINYREPAVRLYRQDTGLAWYMILPQQNQQSGS
jgi:hypothetical protein